jgi:hypothetical protein
MAKVQHTVMINENLNGILHRILLHKGWSLSQAVNEALIAWVAQEIEKIPAAQPVSGP